MYYNGNFYHELSDLVADLDLDEFEIGDTITVEDCDLEPIAMLSAEILMNCLESELEERYSENGDEYGKVLKVLKENIDFDKINSLLPKLWYPNGKEITFTYEELMAAAE